MNSKQINQTGPEDPGVPRSFPSVAWVVILLLTLAVAMLHVFEASSSAGARTEVAQQHLLEQVEGRYAFGIKLVTGDASLAGAVLPGFDQGSMGRRLRGVVLRGQMQGSESARDALLRIEVQAEEAGYVPSASELDIIRLLELRYAEDGGGVGVLGEQGRSFLVEHLGWFGQLATVSSSDPSEMAAVDEPAIRTCIAIFSAVAGFGGGFFVGLVLLIILIVFASMGRLHHGLGSSGPGDGLLAEAFAIWIILFLGMQLLLGFVLVLIPSLEPHALFLVGLIQLVTLAAAAWPVFRGMRWTPVRTAIGLTRGTGLWKELGWGFCGWMMMLPLLAVGVLVMLILMAMTGSGQNGTGFEPTPQPVHPILLSVADGDVWMIIQVYFVAVIVAPLVEETVFRGMLYRQLRSATASMRVVWSVTVSTLVVSVIFAALHPQGLVAIPALASLAIGMSLMREWRGSLAGSMTMHACNNGIMITMMVLLFS
ncbi:MAG: lysostaphin resistance A-like protein [Planctomycetota bacterium]|nr:lysostaphin resistance A-like protein [Planctomycetota bacterium]